MTKKKHISKKFHYYRKSTKQLRKLIKELRRLLLEVVAFLYICHLLSYPLSTLL